MDLPVETDPKTTTTALSACLEVSAAGGTSDSKNGRSGSVTSTRALGTRGTPHRTSTRGRRGCHKRLKKKFHFLQFTTYDNLLQKVAIFNLQFTKKG